MKANKTSGKITIGVFSSSSPVSATVPVRYERGIAYLKSRGYEIVNVSESKSEEIRAKKEWEFVMSQHADINVAINFAAESAEFCWEAAMQQGIRDDMLIYGVDDMPITLDFIKEGKIDGSVVTSFYQYGYEGVRVLYEYVTTGRKPEHIETNLIIVDKDNINHYRELNDGK